MSKPSPSRKKRSFPPAGIEPKPLPQKTLQSDARPVRWGLVALFLVIALGGTYLAIWLRPKTHAPRYTYKLIKEYDHDPAAFTQGLMVANGLLWESTGRYGESTVRKIDLKSGEILKQVKLDDKYFGEGLAVHGNQLFQLTWKSGKAFVYDLELEKVKEFEFEGEGWGLATNGTDLIFSNGTTIIKFLDPATFEMRRSIRVRRPEGLRVGQLNELEYFGGKIYANQYLSDIIYEIEPESGVVTAVIDLSGLWPTKDRPRDGLLNGIAAIPNTRKLLVTGKLCPKIFEIELKLEQ